MLSTAHTRVKEDTSLAGICPEGEASHMAKSGETKVYEAWWIVPPAPMIILKKQLTDGIRRAVMGRMKQMCSLLLQR